jgi:hypothetical protein
MRRRGNTQSALWLLGACLALAPAAGLGQDTGAPNGVKVGEGRLHPFIELHTRLDSAAGFLNPDDPSLAPRLRPELIVHVRPGLRLDVPSPTLALSVNGYLDYLWYTGLLSAGSGNFSRLQGQGAVDLAFNPGGQVEFRVADQLVRSDRVENPAIGVGVLSLYNQARAELALRPGGRALEIVPGASYTFELFSPLSTGVVPGCPETDPLCSPRAAASLNYGNIGLMLRASYKFLPKTALVLDANYNLRDYAGGSRPARLLNATAGLAGLVSPRVALLAKAGYAHDFGAPGVRTVVGNLEATWLISQTASAKLGYLRRLEPIALFGSFVDDRAYVEGRALVGGRLTLRAYAGFDYLSYYEAPRRDYQFRFDAGPEYSVRRWLILGAGYLLTTRASSQSVAQTFNYTRHEGYLRVTLTY